MTGEEKIQYLANLERCKAQQVLHLGNYDPADYRAVYSLWMRAYEDEEKASRARSNAMELYVERACRQART